MLAMDMAVLSLGTASIVGVRQPYDGTTSECHEQNGTMVIICSVILMGASGWMGEWRRWKRNGVCLFVSLFVCVYDIMCPTDRKALYYG